MNEPTFSIPNVGAYVEGSPLGPRKLVQWRNLLNAYADGELNTDHEAYLSHFAFTDAMTAHYVANGRSVAGYSGPTWAKWLVFDIDRSELAEALADARKLARLLLQRFPDVDGSLPVYFSGRKGFHIYLELCNEQPPAIGFNAVCRTLAESLAAFAGITIDTGVYDANRILRLPNTRHPKTGLFKRRIDADALFKLDVDAILDLAKEPAGDGLLTFGDRCPVIAAAWDEAERETKRKADARVAIRTETASGPTAAPKYLLDFLRFGVSEGERHSALFRCAAWMAEQQAPDSLVHAMLTEPGRDVGLAPKDVHRQIECGIAHARRQREGGSTA